MNTQMFNLRLDNSLLDIVSIVPGTVIMSRIGIPYITNENDSNAVMVTNGVVNKVQTNECFVFLDNDNHFPGLVSEFREYKVTPTILFNLGKDIKFKERLFVAPFDKLTYIYPNLFKEKIVFHDKSDTEIYCLPKEDSRNDSDLVIDDNTKTFLGKALHSHSLSFMEKKPIYVVFPDGSHSFYAAKDLTFYAMMKDE